MKSKPAWSASCAQLETSKSLGHKIPKEATLSLQWPPENTGFSHSSTLQTLCKFLLANSRLEQYGDGDRDNYTSRFLFCNVEKTLERSHGDAKLTTNNSNRGTLGTSKFGQRK